MQWDHHGGSHGSGTIMVGRHGGGNIMVGNHGSETIMVGSHGNGNIMVGSHGGGNIMVGNYGSGNLIMGSHGSGNMRPLVTFIYKKMQREMNVSIQCLSIFFSFCPSWTITNVLVKTCLCWAFLSQMNISGNFLYDMIGGMSPRLTQIFLVQIDNKD